MLLNLLQHSSLKQCVSINECLENIKSWKANNFLQLNENKTDVFLVGPPIYKHYNK